MAAGPQVALVMWHWPEACARPQWLGALFEMGARAAALGLLVLKMLGCLAPASG